MRDVPVVAGIAYGGVPQQPAVLRERGCRAGAVHGAEGPGQDVRDDVSEVGEVGEAVKEEVELFSRRSGVIMPHVVSPEVTGGDVITPPIIPKPQGDVPPPLEPSMGSAPISPVASPQ